MKSSFYPKEIFILGCPIIGGRLDLGSLTLRAEAGRDNQNMVAMH